MSDETPSAGEFRIGDRLAGYRLDGVIGRGGMAVVYRAHDERLGRNVALKVLSPRLASDEAFRHRFIRESRAAAAIDHPNIIPVYEAGEAAGVLFITMRFVPGRDVLSLLEQHGPLPAARACHIVTQVAAALDAAHQVGLVHRDVKPANMLRGAAAGEDQLDHIYLSDFGLSKRWQSASNLTSLGEVVGTLNYLSPEQIEGRTVDGRADQYALACSAFEMLGGAPPFARDETMAIMWAQVSAAPPSLSARRPGLPPAVDQVMARALAKAPDDRYATCLEFASALRAACGPGPAARPPRRHDPTVVVSGPPTGPARRPGTPAEPPVPEPAGAGGDQAVTPGPRRYRLLVFAACAVLLGAAGGGYALFGRGPGATATIAAPGCTTATAAARPLTQVHLHLVTTGAKPFDVVAANNGYGFVSLGNGLAVMRTVTAVPALVHTLSLSQAYGEALTHDQRYLLVSGQSGLTVFRVRDLENGNYTPAGTLTSPGGKHAVQVAVSRDDRYAFVTLQYSAHVAVFNLRRALTSGFGPADLVGRIPVGAQPVGITASPDGRYLYVATGLATPARSSGRGTVTVLDLRKAETSPGSSSVLKVVGAGCGPDRIAVSADGRTVWVTVGGGNALVAYSAAKLLSDPRHALIARVAVGQLPLGLMIVKNGSRIIVADSNRDQVAGGASNLAVVDVGKALAGKPALLGVIASGGVPRQFAAEPGGKTLLVANTGSGQVQVVKLAHLP